MFVKHTEKSAAQHYHPNIFLWGKRSVPNLEKESEKMSP